MTGGRKGNKDNELESGNTSDEPTNKDIFNVIREIKRSLNCQGNKFDHIEKRVIDIETNQNDFAERISTEILQVRALVDSVQIQQDSVASNRLQNVNVTSPQEGSLSNNIHGPILTSTQQNFISNNTPSQNSLPFIQNTLKLKDLLSPLRNDKPDNIVTYLKHLQKLSNYNLNEIQLKNVIRNSLHNEIISNWYFVVEDEFANIAQFIELFTNKFWSRTQQENVRLELQWGRYKGFETREVYATRLYRLATNLKPPLSKTEIIFQLSRHFDYEIHQLVLVKEIASYEDFCQLLRNFDRAENFKNDYRYSAKGNKCTDGRHTQRQYTYPQYRHNNNYNENRHHGGTNSHNQHSHSPQNEGHYRNFNGNHQSYDNRNNNRPHNNYNNTRYTERRLDDRFQGNSENRRQNQVNKPYINRDTQNVNVQNIKNDVANKHDYTTFNNNVVIDECCRTEGNSDRLAYPEEASCLITSTISKDIPPDPVSSKKSPASSKKSSFF